MEEIQKDEIQKDEDRAYDLTTLGDSGALTESAELSDESAESEDDSEELKEVSEEIIDEEVASDDPSDSSEESEGVAPEDRESLALRMVRLAVGLLAGEFDEKELLTLSSIADARGAIEKAYSEGEIAGRNAVIEEKLREEPAGVPDLCGSPFPSTHRSDRSIFDLAEAAR